MPRKGIELGDTTPPPTAKDILDYTKLNAVVVIARIVVWASVVLVLGWTGVAILYATKSAVVETMRDALACVIPFWSTLTGVLGYLFTRGRVQ